MDHCQRRGKSLNLQEIKAFPFRDLLPSIMDKREVSMSKLLKVAIFALICLKISCTVGYVVAGSRGIPFIRKITPYDFSIGIYVGNSPFNYFPPNNITNPVLTAKHVTDISASFIADPFMVKHNSAWYMFFEVLNSDTNQGDIGLAVSNDGFNWAYKQIVLDEPFHLSYPYVFKWEGTYYMIPESARAYSIRLYKAINFPVKWAFAVTLLEGQYADPSICHHNNKWWLFAGENNDTLRLYYSDALSGPFTEHPKSPIIVGDADRARPGGRSLILKNRIVRYTQDDDPTYGNKVRAFEITELTRESYEEKEVSENAIVEASGTGWNAEGMHHIDPHQISESRWIACVDGWRFREFRESLVFGLKY